MIGGVLVERNVKEVLPALETNMTGVSSTGDTYTDKAKVLTRINAAESSYGEPSKAVQV